MRDHIKRMLKIAQLQKTDAILVSSVSNIVYLTGFSGFSAEERDAYVLLTKTKNYIFSSSLYKEAIETQMKEFTFEQISMQTSFIQILKQVVKKHKVKILGIETQDMTVAEYTVIKKLVKCKHLDIWKTRIYKQKEEIAAIEKACQIGDDAFKNVLNKIKLGMTELDVALELEYFIKKQNADISFRTIVAFGPHASLPHHVTNNQKLKTNNWILMDFGVKYNNYCSDMTRTVFFGKATAEQKKMYHTVLDAQQKAIDYILGFYSSRERSDSRSNSSRLRSNNISASEPDRIAREHIISKGYPSIPHTLGHGIGIQVHEYPRLSPNTNVNLESGMVFSVEPGIYLPGIGGVRIEDLMVIERSSARLLTHAPRELIEL